MKILLIENMNTSRGAAISMRALVKILATEYNVEFVVMQSYENENTAFYDSIGVSHFVGGFTTHIVTKINDLSWLKKRWVLLKRLRWVLKGDKIAYERLFKVTDVNNIDIVYTNLDRYTIGHKINKKIKIPHIVHLREFGDIDFWGVSAIHKFHSVLDKYVTKYIAISNAVKIHECSFGISEDKIEVIYNGVENNFIITDKSWDSEILKIVIAGAVVPEKGQENVIQALGLLEEEYRGKIVLDIYGSGDENYIKTLLSKADGLNVSVNFLGQSNNLSNLLPNYHVGIIASKAEAFGRVTVEYMMAGVYVIASDTGANPEVVQNCYGSFYSYGNNFDLAKKIQWAYDHREEMAEVAIKARTYAINRYTDKINAKAVYELFARISGVQ